MHFPKKRKDILRTVIVSNTFESTYASIETITESNIFAGFVFSLWYLVSSLRVHAAYIFSIRVCVMNIAARGAEANANRRRGKRRVGSKIDEESKGMVGQMQNRDG